MIRSGASLNQGRITRVAVALAAAGTLTACGFTGARAPVENRSLGGGGSRPLAPRVDPATLPGAEFAGRPGYYTVQPGDTIRSISRALNIDWRDLAQWNSAWIPNPDVIEIGQVLRVVPPSGSSGTVATPTPVRPRPVPVPVQPDPAPSPLPTPEPVAPRVPVTPRPAPSDAAAPHIGVALAWPTRNTGVVTSFDGVRSKGIAIAGKEGDPVYASADGRVMYAGSGLRGYGNLVLIKHNNTLLTVYAHNSALLVKEGQNVKKGQQIASMGKTDADRVKLHFEVRRNGKTVNPLSYLPAR
ncbi:MAG: peptidoglycan DD-metalloendopeptidase family protein [Brachymonas sp.]|nr:peptidoglycan DD-metalloendopeptidase family protein [Brachymonas sp.]